MKNSNLKSVVYSNVYQNNSKGYVLTPSELAFEMISTLPDSVFESSATTFLDPICKSGTFLFEIVEKLYDRGHSISNIQKRIYTIDSNSHSLNIANSYIKKILNRESGYLKVDFKYDFTQKYFNRLVSFITGGKYLTFDDFMSIILLDKKENYLMAQLKNSISDFIAKYEKVSKLESKLFGEVFTPRELIDQMLDTLPKDVWGNPDLKWLDPAVGIGNFPNAILDRLMKGLDLIIPNEDDRRKHILEEMLYMCDISTKNLFLLYQLFDKNNDFKLNVYRGSFLTEDFDKHMKGVWGLDGFDVVVGNPPYQRSNSKTHKLWVDFLEKGLNISNKLCFVTPTLLCDGLSKKISDIRKKILPYLEVVNFKHKNIFNIGETVFFYYLNKEKQNNITITHTEYLVEENKYDDIIFIDKSDIIKFSIISKITKNQNFLQFYSDIKNTDGDAAPKRLIERGLASISKDDIFKYLLHHSASNKLFFKEKMSSGKLKIVFNYSGGYYDPKDPDRYIFITDAIVGKQLESILISSVDEGYRIRNIYSKKIFRYFIQSEKTGGFNTGIFKLPKIDFSKKWSDSDLYEYFNLTQEEIDLIEKTIKD
jgi:site-specific DNA-methyltransferase (adenine-specific)